MDNFILVPKQVNMHWSYTKGSNFLKKLNLDLTILVCMALLFTTSMLVLYSAKLDIIIVQKQAVRIGISLALLLIVAHLPPRILKAWAPIIYCISLATLGLVLAGIGVSSKGATRWLELGVIRFQPAELMKLAVPLMVAKSLNERVLPPPNKFLLIPTAYILLPATLIAMQPDLGTAILVAASGFFVIFFAGIKWRTIFSLSALGVVTTPIFWMFLKDYQKERILTLLNPSSDPLGSGYHIIQSKIAIGSGGIYGKGWLNGTQSHLEYLPERTTDFIFSVFSEEFGLIGILCLLTIYSIIIVRCLYIGARAHDTFSRLITGSITMSFFVYIFVNIGMVSGILPVVGIPLPLISYGGTSLLTIMIGFGIIMSIQSHRSLVAK